MPDAADQRPRWGIGDAVAATVVGIVVSAVVAGVVLGVAGADSSDDLALWVIALLQLPLWVGLAGVPVYVSRRKGTGSLAADFGLRMRWSDIPVGLGVGLLSQVVFGIVFPPLYRLVGLDAGKIGDTAQGLGDRANDPFGVVCLVLMVVVGAAVVEELCYRGLWLRALERRVGTAAAVIVSGLVFGLIHFQPYDLPILASFGIVLAVLATRSGRLGPAIWAHMAFNATAVIVLLS